MAIDCCTPLIQISCGPLLSYILQGMRNLPIVKVFFEQEIVVFIDLKLPRMDSNHDSQIQNLKSYRLDDRAIIITRDSFLSSYPPR